MTLARWGKILGIIASCIAIIGGIAGGIVWVARSAIAVESRLTTIEVRADERQQATDRRLSSIETGVRRIEAALPVLHVPTDTPTGIAWR